MAKNDFTKRGSMIVSAYIGAEMYNQARELQEQGMEEANWSNAMRRGLKIVIDCANGIDLPEDTIKRLKQRLVSEIQEKEALKQQMEGLQHGNI